VFWVNERPYDIFGGKSELHKVGRSSVPERPEPTTDPHDLKIEVSVDKELNGPVTVEVVLIHQEDLVDIFTKQTAREWFNNRSQLEREAGYRDCHRVPKPANVYSCQSALRGSR